MAMGSVDEIAIRPIRADDQEWIRSTLADAWGSTEVIGHGVRYDASTLPGLIAEARGRRVGLLTYDLTGTGLEVVTIDAVTPGAGVGTALLAAATQTARRAGAERLWLITTNDNLDALRFYQRRGLRIVAVTSDAVAESRRLKPSIPRVGAYGVELLDELTLELRLSPSR
jgi:GNAT superfamily N-acetyltransferase